MRGNARKTVDTLYLKSEMVYREIKSRKDAKQHLKELGPAGPELHEQYIKEVLPYWKKYNLKPAEYWFRYFSQDGIHTDPRYIPEPFCRITAICSSGGPMKTNVCIMYCFLTLRGQGRL